MSARLSGGRTIEIIPGCFRLALAHNRGAAFGILSGGGLPGQRYFFIVVSLLALLLLAWMFRHVGGQSLPGALALGAIAGGALGNLADRVRLGYVVDFLDCFIGRYHWPTFNVADSAITTGVALLLLDAIVLEPRRARKAAAVAPCDAKLTG